MADIIGRTDQLKSLRTLYSAESALFLAVYGRRRSGKTFLIGELFRAKGPHFELTEIKDAPIKVQLSNFAREYADVFNFKKIPNAAGPLAPSFRSIATARAGSGSRRGDYSILR